MQLGKKKFEAYNTTTEWKLDNAKQVEIETDMNTLFECSQEAADARRKILEAEILRDAGMIEVARNFGFTIKTYRQLQVVLQKRPFWNGVINGGKHKCSGSVCVRCKVCGTRSTEHTIEQFIAYRARPQSKTKMQNLDLASIHRCGSENPDEVEFIDRCYLKSLVKDRIYESYREPGVTVIATGSWFMCMNSGLLHYCKNDESCSKMSLEIHDGSPLSYSCALTSLAKKAVVESWQAWDGVHFHSVARINSIQNSIVIKQISVIEEGGGDDFGEDFMADMDTDELLPAKAPRKKGKAKAEPITEEQEVTTKRKFGAFIVDEEVAEENGVIVPASKKLKEDLEIENSESPAIEDTSEEDEKSNESVEQVVKQKAHHFNPFNDFNCYEIPTYDINALITKFEEDAKKSAMELRELEAVREETDESNLNNQRMAYGSQSYASLSVDTYSLLKTIRREMKSEQAKKKLQVQNSAVKRETISASGVSQPVSMSLEGGEPGSCFTVSVKDFFSTNFQMTKEQKIAAFLSRGTIERARAFVRELISGPLKTKIAFLVAEESAKRANVYIADLLNRYDMPLMSAVSFWMEKTSQLINGPIYYGSMDVDVEYYAQVVVEHWKEFVLADYMEELLTERKKRKTKQMDFSLFAVGVLYTLASGGVTARPACQDSKAIPELFHGTKVQERLLDGVLVRELPIGSEDLAAALVSSKYLMYISQIYSRGYHFDADTLADGKQVFRLCYTYRHQNAQNKLFARANAAVYTSDAERESLARELYTDYIRELVPPHTKAGCKRTIKA